MEICIITKRTLLLLMKKITGLAFVIFFLSLYSSFAFIDQFDKNEYLHLPGINVGSVTIFGNYTAAAVDVNYEFKQNKWNYGFGVFGEFAIGKYTEFLTGMTIFSHDSFTKNLDLYFGCGLGFIDNMNYLKYNGDPQKNPPNEMTLFRNNMRANLLWRFGTAYEFIITKDDKPIIIAAPNLNFDIISSYKTYMTLGVKFNYIIK